MAETGSKKGRVLIVDNPPWGGAYLYNFPVDGSRLSDEHRHWLKAAIVAPARISTCNPALFPNGKDHWWTFLCGTTSRTGGFGHNLGLSGRRVAAVSDYLRRELDTLRYKINDCWAGEILAGLKGRADSVEHPLDRAVIVMTRLHTKPEKPQPPPPISRPTTQTGVAIPCCYALQEVALFSAALESWLPELGSGTGTSSTPDSRGYATSGRKDRGELDSAGFVQPAKGWSLGMLTTWGFTHERAIEIYQSHPYFRARMDLVESHHQYLQRELNSFVQFAVNCIEDNANELCAKGSPTYFGEALQDWTKKKIWAEMRRLKANLPSSSSAAPKAR